VGGTLFFSIFLDRFCSTCDVSLEGQWLHFGETWLFCLCIDTLRAQDIFGTLLSFVFSRPAFCLPESTRLEVQRLSLLGNALFERIGWSSSESSGSVDSEVIGRSGPGTASCGSQTRGGTEDESAGG